MKAKTARKQEKNTSWLTTDEEQCALRCERAKEEKFYVRRVQDSPFPPFHTYEVSKPDSPLSKYIVELRSLRHDINTCSCPDFATNGLGTCKHIEKVNLYSSVSH